jgi:mono/diheme cytochrome c family protein
MSDPASSPGRRSSERAASMKYVLIFFASALGVAVLAAAAALSGVISVAANHYGPLDARADSLLNAVSTASIRQHAPHAANPFTGDRAATAEGLAEFRESCISCHGARAIAPAEFAAGLNPGAPALDSPEIQSMSDGELFWVVSNGIRATGMPAFSGSKDEKQIWKIVAFARRLPRLTEEETKRLRAGGEAR